MNKPNELTSIHQLLKAIRGESSASESDPASLKEAGKTDSQPVSKEQPPRQPSRLTALKKELKKADALLYQLEQDDVLPAPSATKPRMPKPHRPCCFIRQATQARPLFTKTSLGLDIGSSAIKVVELGHTPAGHTLLHYALVEVASAAKNSPNYSKELVKGISSAIAGVDLGQAEVGTSIGGSSTIIQQLSLPPMPEAELSAYLGWEAKGLIPNNKQEIELGFRLIKGSNQSSQIEALLVAVPRSLILKHRKLMTQARLKSMFTDMAPLALINAYLAEGKQLTDEALVLLDIGAETTTLIIYREKGGYFVRHISISGNQLTRQIQKGLKMEPLQAEEWKRHPQSGVIECLKPQLKRMILEVRQTFIHYRNKTLTRNFNQLMLTGGGAQLPQLASYLSRELGLDVEVFNPLTKLNIDGSHLAQGDLALFSSQFATAAGLAIRGVEQEDLAWQ